MSPDLFLLMVSLFTWGIGEGLFFVFQPIYLGELGAGTLTIAAVYSAFGGAMLAAHIPAGYLADRIGRKPMLLAAWTSGLIATWVMALTTNLTVFIMGMLMYGLTAFVSSPLNSYVTAARGRLTIARAMTLMSASFSFGAVIGPLTGGWIGDRMGLRSVYFIAGGLFVISTIVLFFLKKQPRDIHDPEAPPVKLFSNSRFMGLMVIIFLVMFSTYLPQPLTARFLSNERILSLSAIGLLGSINGLGNALFNLALGQFSSRLGLVLVQVCVAVYTLLIWRGTGLGWYLAGYFILGGYRTARAFLFSMVRDLVHSAQMGLAYGVTETFNSLAAVTAPLLAGALYNREPALVYPVALGLLGATLVVTLLFTQQGKKVEPTEVVHSLEL